MSAAPCSRVGVGNGFVGTPAEPIAVSSVLDLFTHVDDPQRVLPVVIISVAWNAERHGVPPRRLASELAGRASVWVLPDPGSSRMLDVRDDLATYGGAVRVIGSDGWSTIVRTDKAPGEPAVNRVKNAVAMALTRVGDRTTPGPPRVTGTGQDSAQQPGRTPDPAAAGGEDDAGVQAQIDELRRSVRQLQHELSQVRSAGETPASGETRLFADDEDQLRHDIHQAWLRQVAECDRDDYALRSYRVGSRFLEGVNGVAASRDRVINVAVDVLTRRAYSMPARRVHPHGTHRAGRQLTRDDGGIAYRASVKDCTAGAPRLLWWELVDGTVELGWVGHHDDPMP